MREHTHRAGEWCDECAHAAEIMSLSKYDYQNNAWYFDSLSTFRTILEGGSGDSLPPVAQGTYWLVERLVWTFSGASPTITLASLPAVGVGGIAIAPLVTSPIWDGAAVRALTSDERAFSPALQLPAGSSISLLDMGTHTAMVTIHYRIRTTVPSPVETRRRIFSTPVITPDGGSPESAAPDPVPTPARLTELDTSSFKNSDI